MPVAAAIPLFLASLCVTLLSARLFARRLDRLGVRFGFPEALIGLLTALAADGPELSSALFALARGAGGVGVGVLVGSNVFNLAAMIGLSALLSGRVRLPRRTLLGEGVPAVAITLLGAAVILRWLSAPQAVGLSAAVLLPYLALVIGVPGALVIGVPGALLARVIGVSRRGPPPAPPEGHPARQLLALLALDLVLIIAGSAGMVQAALALGAAWHISQATLGTLILAPLTSLPNAATALRLGRAGRGAALVGETFNSNTINLAAGVILPALILAPALPGAGGRLELGWLVGMTVLCLVLLARTRGMGRAAGLAVIAGYLGFVALALS
jgi:cation:H+ antiporter